MAISGSSTPAGGEDGGEGDGGGFDSQCCIAEANRICTVPGEEVLFFGDQASFRADEDNNIVFIRQ